MLEYVGELLGRFYRFRRVLDLLVMERPPGGHDPLVLSLILALTRFQAIHNIFSADVSLCPHFTKEIDSLCQRQVEQIGRFPEG